MTRPTPVDPLTEPGTSPDLVVEDVTALLHDDAGALVAAEHRSIIVRDGAIVAVLDNTGGPDRR